MNKEIADRWVAALRSGRYKQARGALRDILDSGTPAYCCLGVLCDISDVGYWETRDHDDNVYVCHSGQNSEVVLPRPVAEWAGIATPEGTYDLLNNVSLAKLNDNGMTFDAIADVIEARWEKL
jgi:hypothetical protein